MGELQDFVAEILERQGAVVDALPGERLEVLAPEPLREAMGWPELAELRFGAHGADERAIRIGLEGDWLDRFGALLGRRGCWARRQLRVPEPAPAPADPERQLDRALDLPNAVWRFKGLTPAFTRCLVLAFRYTALSDEKREGLLWLGFNLATGAVLDEIVVRLRQVAAGEPQWQAPGPELCQATEGGWEPKTLQSRVRLLLEHRGRLELEAFMAAARRRLERDRSRVHAYHNDLWTVSMKRLSALDGVEGNKAQADREREKLRMAAIEREYHAKLDDLRHNYATRVVVEWVQALELLVPVHRCEVLIRRRKGERRIQLDWHPLVRLMEPPPCDWGLGLGRTRLVCDDRLHLTDPAGQEPCPSCAKPWCRACHPIRCPRCGAAANIGG